LQNSYVQKYPCLNRRKVLKNPEKSDIIVIILSVILKRKKSLFDFPSDIRV
jgi:hypothetical protein